MAGANACKLLNDGGTASGCDKSNGLAVLLKLQSITLQRCVQILDYSL
ncbi:hypothetical protein [Sandaracinobacter sp.]